jgi:hypothetical protein
MELRQEFQELSEKFHPTRPRSADEDPILSLAPEAPKAPAAPKSLVLCCGIRWSVDPETDPLVSLPLTRITFDGRCKSCGRVLSTREPKSPWPVPSETESRIEHAETLLDLERRTTIKKAAAIILDLAISLDEDAGIARTEEVRQALKWAYGKVLALAHEAES